MKERSKAPMKADAGTPAPTDQSNSAGKQIGLCDGVQANSSKE